MAEQAIFTTMCMVYNDDGEVVLQNRVDASWSGLSFPGGHVEPNEVFLDAAIREVKEETGLSISQLELCGVKQFQTPNGERYVVFLYKTKVYSGQLISSSEGEVAWFSLKDIPRMKCAVSFYEMIELFTNPGLSEGYYSHEGKLILK